ncbi:MAG TPA: DUF3662 and FHA domain-containing protein [Gaiellaceae bacterium]|nr:DUF3662 and FHA domain-containing protein [Gaiellaceae bacterium]
MALLRSIESKIEGLFEGVFGRAFRTHVQPIELARKLVKEMDDHRTVSVSRVYVPNEYTVYLSPQDRRQFSGYESALISELQEYLAQHAHRESYVVLTPPRVLLTTDGDLAVGEFGIATRVAADERSAEAELPPVPGDEAPAATVIYRAPPSPEEAAQPWDDVVTLTVAGKTHAVTSERVVLGRSREADVRIDDANVSRRHAEVTRDGDGFWIADLGSTNGTLLNGERVARAHLDDGDRITIGSTEVVFGRSPRQ